MLRPKDLVACFDRQPYLKMWPSLFFYAFARKEVSNKTQTSMRMPLNYILLHFLRWKTSLDLAKALCDVQLKKVMSKRKRPNINIGDFPSPEELASFREEELKGEGKFGYRAADLINLAKQVVDGIIELSKFEIADEPSARFKLKINGAGPFTTHTIMMCTGYYHNIPIDTETLRHMKQVHPLFSFSYLIIYSCFTCSAFCFFSCIENK